MRFARRRRCTNRCVLGTGKGFNPEDFELRKPRTAVKPLLRPSQHDREQEETEYLFR